MVLLAAARLDRQGLLERVIPHPKDFLSRNRALATLLKLHLDVLQRDGLRNVALAHLAHT